MIALLLAAQIAAPPVEAPQVDVPQVGLPRSADQTLADIAAAPAPELKRSAPRRVIVRPPAAPPSYRMPVIGLGSDCKNPQVRVVDPKWRPQVFHAPPASQRPHGLHQEPRAAHELAVDRRWDGCRVRTVVSYPEGQ